MMTLTPRGPYSRPCPRAAEVRRQRRSTARVGSARSCAQRRTCCSPSSLTPVGADQIEPGDSRNAIRRPCLHVLVQRTSAGHRAGRPADDASARRGPRLRSCCSTGRARSEAGPAQHLDAASGRVAEHDDHPVRAASASEPQQCRHSGRRQLGHLGEIDNDGPTASAHQHWQAPPQLSKGISHVGVAELDHDLGARRPRAASRRRSELLSERVPS